MFKSCLSHKSARIFISESYFSPALLLLVVLIFFGRFFPRLKGSFKRQQAVELPSREAIGSTSTAASVIADETQLHFSPSGLSPLLDCSAKRWRDEIQTYNISSIFNWLAYSWVRIYFFFRAQSPNIIDSIIFPKVLSSQTPAGLYYQVCPLSWVWSDVKCNEFQVTQNKNISLYKHGSVSSMNASCSTLK